MIKYEKQRYDGTDIFYNVTDDGFDIYFGSTANLTYTQHEPFIPDHSKSYEENAIQMCEDLCKEPEHHESIEDRVTNIEANIDYLMLLNDPDSASESVTE